MCGYLSSYQFCLQYKKVTENQVADALSRLPQEATADDIEGTCRLIDCGDSEVYFVGAANFLPRYCLGTVAGDRPRLIPFM